MLRVTTLLFVFTLAIPSGVVWALNPPNVCLESCLKDCGIDRELCFARLKIMPEGDGKRAEEEKCRQTERACVQDCGHKCP
jgi:hypothetical protein